MGKLVKKAGRDKIEAMPDRVIVLKNAGASAQAIDEANFRIKYAEVLNAAQLAAVTHRNGPLLVVASAGSGKTRTLIYRVARLCDRGELAMLGVGLLERGCPPQAVHLLGLRQLSHAAITHYSVFLLLDALARERVEISAGTLGLRGYEVVGVREEKLVPVAREQDLEVNGGGAAEPH